MWCALFLLANVAMVLSENVANVEVSQKRATCTNDTDCLGGISGGIACNVTSGTCYYPCTSNDNCTSGLNCYSSGICSVCTTDLDCFENDGGEITNQPVCQLNGQCGACAFNVDCPTSAANCGADGLCFNCSAPENECGIFDGGETAGQANCDAYSGICVSTCVSDANCTDTCFPRCNTDRSCCVECLVNTDCPHSNWRLAQATYSICSTESYTCVHGCSVDTDCSGSTPACSPTQGTCVECLFDSHCTTTGLLACNTAAQQCVQCEFDNHCPNDLVCSGDNLCEECISNYDCPPVALAGETVQRVCVSNQCTLGNPSSGVALGASLVMVFATLFSLLF